MSPKICPCGQPGRTSIAFSTPCHAAAGRGGLPAQLPDRRRGVGDALEDADPAVGDGRRPAPPPAVVFTCATWASDVPPPANPIASAVATLNHLCATASASLF